MRQWIPLDVRNVNNPIALRNQLRRLNEYMSDLAASLASPDLVPQQPDSTTVFNNILQQIAVSAGKDPKTLVFFDDFIADLQSDPSPGASGAWRHQGSGASSIGTSVTETDPTAIGVWLMQSEGVVGGAHEAMSPSDNATFPLSLLPGLEIGARIRLHSTDFTRGLFSFGLTDANLSGSNSQQGTVRAAFLIWVTDADYFPSAGLLQDFAIFESADAAGGANYQFLDSGRSGSSFKGATFVNVKMVVSAEQTIDCYVNGQKIGSLTGTHVPASTVKLALRIRQQTNGNTNVGVTQKSYIDQIYIDASRIDRGAN